MSRTPDFILRALNKETGEKSGNIGAAWLNENGSLSLTFAMMVTIQNSPDMVYTLFPYESDEARELRFRKANYKKKEKANTMENLPPSVQHRG